MKNLKIGSERTYRIVKRGATRDLPVLYDADSSPLGEIGIAGDHRKEDWTLEVVKDFEEIIPVTVDEGLQLAEDLVKFDDLNGYEQTRSKFGKIVEKARDLLSRRAS